MRSIFDDDDQPRRAQSTRDTELTLGSGTLLAIFCGLVLLCGLCFGTGYSMGHRSPVAAVSAPQSPAPDQEPLQANGNIPKPSAMVQTPIAPDDAPTAGQPQPAAAPGAARWPAVSQPGTENAGNGTGGVAQGPDAGSPRGSDQVHPALAPGAAQQSYGDARQPYGALQQNSGAAAQTIRPALAQSPLMVQIAAVSNSEDAQVLISALRKRNYPVSARREQGDNFIHVCIGPFATRALADQWRMKLLNDGYNAVVQP